MANKWETAPIVGGQSQPEPQQPAWASAPVVEEEAAPKNGYDVFADTVGPWLLGPTVGFGLTSAEKLGLIDRNQASGIPRKIRNSLTLGFDDEIVGAGASVGEMLGMQEEGTADKVRAAERRALKDYETAHPGQALAVGIGANLATLPLLPAKAFQGANLGSRMLKGAGVGGGYGFATGFGGGEGETAAEGFGNRLQEGLTSGGTGAVLGGATVPVAETIGKVVGAAAQPLKAWMMPTRTANQKILESLSRDQMGASVLNAGKKTAMKRLMDDPDTLIADLGGVNFQGTIKQAMRMPNAQREVFKTKLDARQGRQVARFTQELGKRLGTPEKYDDALETLLKKRSEQAGPIFKRAFSQPVATSPEAKKEIGSLLMTPIGQRLYKNAIEAMKNERKAVDGMNSTEVIHYIKMQVDRAMNAAKRGQVEGQQAWDYHTLKMFKTQLMNAVENKTYKLALSKYADASKIKTAAERGFQQGFKEDAGEIASAMRRMTPRERDAYRLGLGKWLVTKIRSGNRMHDRVARDFSDKNFMDKVRPALGGKAWKGNPTKTQGPVKRALPTEYRELQQFINAKGTQAASRRALQGGSDTAQNLNEAGNLAQQAEKVKSVAKGLIDPAEMMGFFARQYSSMTGLTPGVANAILKRVGQPANRATYSGTVGPRTLDDVDRALAALKSGKPLKDINAKYRDIVKALIASEGYLAGSSE